MKKGLKIFSVASAFVLLVGGAVALAKQDKKQALQTKAAVDTTSYTMTAREIVGALGRYSDSTGAITDDNNLRLTADGTGQFRYFFNDSDARNFRVLSDDCVSLTLTLKISAATELGARIFCRCWKEGDVEDYAWLDMDLAAAEADFISVTFNKLESGKYFDGFIFQAEAEGAYVDIKSITFNGLTSFSVVNFVAIQGGWNHYDRGNGTHSTLFRYDANFGTATASGVDYAPQLGEKVTFNGHPFQEAGTINHEHGNNYFQFTYVDSFMAQFETPVIEIKDVIFFEKAFIEPIRIVFNGTEWEVKNLIADDPLIKNSDFVLYGPDDYDFGKDHDGWAFHTWDAMPELTGHQSFGLQFTMKSGEDDNGYFQLKFGSGVTTHDAFLFTYYNQLLYLEQIKGGDPGLPNNEKEFAINLADQQQRTLEFYVIKDSDTTAVIMVGIDGVKAFKSRSIDISTIPEWNHMALQLIQGSFGKTTIDASIETRNDALGKFYDKKLANYAAPYMTAYAEANTYMDTYLTPGQRDAFENSSAYASINAKYRLLRAEAINEYATPKKTELENYIADLSIYTADDQAAIADIITAGKDAMSRATSYEQVDEILVEYKALLDEVPTAAERLVEYKAAAKAELDSYLDEEDYLPADWNVAQQWIQNGKDNIDVCVDFHDVDQMLETMKENLDTIPTAAERQQELEEAKAAGKAEIAAYKADVVYREAQQQQRTEIVERHSSLIDNITQYSGIGQIAVEVEAAKEAIDALPTKAELDLQDAQAVEAKIAAIGEVDCSQSVLVKKTDARNAYNSLNAEAQAMVSNYAVLTAAEEAFETALANYKTAVKNGLQQELQQILPNYRAAEQQQIQQAATQTATAIDAGEYKEGIDAVVDAARAQLATIKTADDYDHEEADAVETLIANIGTVTLNSEDAILAAKAAYNALTAGGKGYVTNYATLQAAEARLTELKQEKANADAVVTLINAIGTVDASQASKNKIDAAYNAYQALNAEEKSMVSNKVALDAALANFDNLLGQARQAALDEIDEYVAGLNMKKYSKDNQELIAQLAEDAKALVQQQEYNDNLAQIVADFEAAVDEVPQKKAAKKGCGGSVVATSIVLSTLALAGLGLTISKKREEE